MRKTGIHIYFRTKYNIRNCPPAQPQLLGSETATDITWDKQFSSIQNNPKFVWYMKGLLLIILSLSSTWQEFFDIFCPSLFATWMKSHPPSKGICNEMDELDYTSRHGKVWMDDGTNRVTRTSLPLLSTTLTLETTPPRQSTSRSMTTRQPCPTPQEEATTFAKKFGIQTYTALGHELQYK